MVHIPAHATAFFAPVLVPGAPERSGSLGAGMCFEWGACSEVEVKLTEAEVLKTKIATYINGKAAAAKTTERALQMLCAKAPPAFYEIKVHTSHSLPIGQGFGLSAAGALSAASALRAAINSTLTNRLAGQSKPRSLLTEDAAVAAAHCAEVELLTGLGDVVAEAVGGIPIRVKAGAPPHCELQQLWEFQKNTVDTNLEIVLCVLDAPRPTHTILSNSMLREKICRYGKLCLQKLLEQPALENMFSLANSFAKKTGLLTDAAAAALAAVKRARGMGAMALLGNAIFALSSDNAKLAECLQAHGTVYRMPLSKPTATLPHYTLSHHVYRKLSH